MRAQLFCWAYIRDFHESTKPEESASRSTPCPPSPSHKCSELWPKKSLPSQATKNIRQCRVFPGAAKGASFLLPPIYHLPLYSQHIDPPLGYSQHLSTNHHLPTHSFHSHSSCFASFCGLWIVACFHVISKLPTY